MIRFSEKLPVVCAALALSCAPLCAKDKPPPAPVLDPNRIINDSFGFLKDREPEMTETEHALYEKIVPMVATQPELALKLLESMMAATDTSPAFDFVLGNVYFEQKKLTEAEARYKRAVGKFPTFIRAWDNLGVLYYTVGRYADAVPCFSKVITLGEWLPRNLGLMAYCLAQSGNSLAAEMAYTQAYALEPTNTDWIEGLLSTYLDSGQVAQAESLLRQLVRLKPREIHFWRLLVRNLVTQDRKLDAIAMLEVASSLGVLDDDGIVMMGDLFVDLKMHGEAVLTYARVSKGAAPIGVERMLRYARALIAERNLPLAEMTILAASAMELPKESKAGLLQAKAELARAREDWKQARAFWEELVSLDPLNGRAQLDLGQAYQRLGEPDRATFALEAAAAVAESAFVANLHLANLKVKTGHYPEALVFIDKALSLQKTAELLNFQARVKALISRHE